MKNVEIRRDASVAAIENDVSEDEDIQVPLAYRAPAFEVMANPVSAGAIEQLRREFTRELGEPAKDATAAAQPEYRARWQDAQFLADERFRSLFGWEAFNEQEIASAREAAGQP